MSYSFDYQMAQMHALLGWAALALFLLRGVAAFQFGKRWAMDVRVRVVVFSVHFLLVMTGLSLWALRYDDPTRQSWFAAKLIGVIAFAGCAHWAMGNERFRLDGYLAGLLVLTYVALVSVTRSATLGLV